MKKITLAFLTSISLTTLVLLTSCSTTTEPSEAYKGESPEQIFTKGQQSLRDRDYSESIKRFEALEVQYPFGQNAEKAQLYLIYAYYKKEEYALSIAEADRFIRAYPASPQVSYAYFMRGLANYYQGQGVFERFFPIDMATRDLTQLKKSYQDFSELVQHFPNSPYAPAAYQYMIYLRNLLANHQLQVAQYYYSRKAYVAAVNRASGVVANYQGAPAVRPALELMLNSYHELGLPQAERDVRRVMYNNIQGDPR